MFCQLFPEYNKNMHNGGWGFSDVKGMVLTGMEIGMVSLSSTARALLLLLVPFRCDILAYDPCAAEGRPTRYEVDPKRWDLLA